MCPGQGAVELVLPGQYSQAELFGRAELAQGDGHGFSLAPCSRHYVVPAVTFVQSGACREGVRGPTLALAKKRHQNPTGESHKEFRCPVRTNPRFSTR